MSNYTTQARDIKRQQYGIYCNRCRVLEIKPVPYSKFTIEIGNAIKLAMHSTYGKLDVNEAVTLPSKE